MFIIGNFILIKVVIILYNYIEYNNCIQNYKFLISSFSFVCVRIFMLSIFTFSKFYYLNLLFKNPLAFNININNKL